jgi:hypothetical protein
MKFDDLGDETYRGSIAGGGRNVEEGKLPVGLYAKVFTVGPPELAAKPD